MKKLESNSQYDETFQRLILGMATKTWNKEKTNDLFNYESHSFNFRNGNKNLE